MSLLKILKDGFYPGMHLQPEGTIVATTYTHYREGDVGCSIISVCFKIRKSDWPAANASAGGTP